jgi:hypothetical protein
MIIRVFLTASLMLIWGCAMGHGGAGRHYMCPMHAEVTSTNPGKCAKCGMMLAATQPAAPPKSAHQH